MRTRIHINLEVRDLDRSVGFYEALFGTSATKRREDYANFRLDEPALHLALVLRPDRRLAPTDQHFGVELFEDDVLNAWRARVEARGVATRIEEEVTCCYAVANKFWAADPDGNEWEFWVRHAEAERMREAEEGAQAGDGACCAPMPMSTLAALEPLPEPGTDDEPGGCCP